ncbi:ROK family protein [Microbacterium sp. H1-D42]|uniref:ROK family protein n=1 Tax=Microbacterium sp. H1-D42 TaxID=2925844 RepID=UPI001F53AAE3|nr:ROK family protein [Microbacterium sp. H1-D42]UNK70996.1 ROK family protein [Microbacterium sp. H1-D42]
MSVLGIDFGGTKVALRAEAPDGDCAEERLQIEDGENAEEVLSRTFETARRLVDQIGPLASVGISTPGIVFDDRVDLAPNVIGWSDLELGHRMQAEFGVSSLRIENDVKAASLAECREGALSGVDIGLYVNLGTGIAISPVIAGEVLRGAHGSAGEVGYAVIDIHDGVTLEEFAGGSGLGRRVAAAQDVPATDVASLVAAIPHSEAARRMWADAVDEIARHLITAVLTIDPSRIVIGGGMTRAGDALLVPLSERLTGAIPYPPQIVPSAFGADASLRGAMILARPAA